MISFFHLEGKYKINCLSFFCLIIQGCYSDVCYISQVHAAFPRLVLHIHDDDLSVRLACRVMIISFTLLSLKIFLKATS